MRDLDDALPDGWMARAIETADAKVAEARRQKRIEAENAELRASNQSLESELAALREVNAKLQDEMRRLLAGHWGDR